MTSALALAIPPELEPVSPEPSDPLWLSAMRSLTCRKSASFRARRSSLGDGESDIGPLPPQVPLNGCCTAGGTNEPLGVGAALGVPAPNPAFARVRVPVAVRLAGPMPNGRAPSIDGSYLDLEAAGARRLGSVYWREVRRSTHGLVRVGESPEGVEIRLVGRPTLLRFSAPEVTVAPDAVTCVYPIVGGLLARERSGTITFAQRQLEDRVLVESAIAGFHPTLAARPGGPAAGTAGEGRTSGSAHDMQKRARAGFSSPQDGQTGMARV
jgi:hypothetical protein